MVELFDFLRLNGNCAAYGALLACGITVRGACGFNRGDDFGRVRKLRNYFFDVTLAAAFAAALFKSFLGAGRFLCDLDVLKVMTARVDERHGAVAAFRAIVSRSVAGLGAGGLFSLNLDIVVVCRGNGFNSRADRAAYGADLADGGAGCCAGGSDGGSNVPNMSLRNNNVGLLDDSSAAIALRAFL